MHIVTVSHHRHVITKRLTAEARLAGVVAIFKVRYPQFTITVEEV